MNLLFSRLHAVFWPVSLLPLQPPWRSLQDEEHGAAGRECLHRGLQTMSRYVWSCMHTYHSVHCFTVFSAALPETSCQGFPSCTTSAGPDWMKTHWPFVTWIIKPKKTVCLPKFQFQLGRCEWMGWIVADPSRRVVRWGGGAVCFTGGCLLSSKPSAFLLRCRLARVEEVWRHRAVCIIYSSGGIYGFSVVTICNSSLFWQILVLFYSFTVFFSHF